MSDSPLTAAQEWKAHWGLVLACAVGFSLSSVAVYSIGLFIEPLDAEFGWGRAKITAGMTIAAFLAIPLSPLLGVLIDRWGSRRLAIPGIIVTAACISAFALANGSTVQWLGLWTAYAILSLGVKLTMWTAAVSSVFSSARGLALALTLTGTALTQILIPPIANWLIDGFGWRMAWIWLAVGWSVPALILCLMFLFDAHDARRKASKKGDTKAAVDLTGLSVREAARIPELLRVATATLIMIVLTIGLIVHQVPVLTESGISRTSAAYLASLTGVAGIIGKLVTGFLLDRYHASWIGGLSIGVTAVALVMLLEPFRSPILIVVSMIIIGYSSGCKMQIFAYLTSRYAGMKNFGKIFGVMSSLVALGSGLGPVVAGGIYDIFGSYTPLILGGIPAALISGFLLIGLGPYPEWKMGEYSQIPDSVLNKSS